MKLVIIGGGGFRVPQVVEAISSRADRSPVRHIVLYDTDPDRLQVVQSIAEAIAGRDNGLRVESNTNLTSALVGADFVFSSMRVGGTESRTKDERGALNLGILGQETVGPGGLVYALRTLPTAIELSETVAEHAPDAHVINFTNPAGIITQAMRRALADRVVGICDSPIGLVRRVAASLGVTADDVTFDYVGINHLGWLRSLEHAGRNKLPELLADDDAVLALEEGRLFGPEWLRAVGSIPNEYLYYYYSHREALQHILDAEKTRGESLHQQQGDFYARALSATNEEALAMWEEVHERREATYMRESREGTVRERSAWECGGYHEVALDLMTALSGHGDAQMILNVANNVDGERLVAQLHDDSVVEVRCLVDADGVRPQRVAPVTGDFAALMLQVKSSEELVLKAYDGGSRDAFWRAIATHPLVDSVNLADRVVDAYAQAFPCVDELS